MSADNWRVCPRCKARAEIEKEAATLRALTSYGQVPRDEYETLREAATRSVSLEETLSEYYEVGLTESGLFYLSYSGECQTCGLAHRYKHEEQLNISPEAPA